MKKQKNNKKVKVSVIVATISIILVIGVALLLFLGSKKDSTLPKITKKNSSTPTIESNLKIVDLNSKTRPYAIMINNLGVARPLQSGLQDAMIIYEMIVEGGLTRYMAVFQDQNTERIGSIRSARHYFLDYALENDAIYVHHGNSPQAAADFKTLNIDRISVDASKTGWRDKSLNVSTEHTLFTSIAKLNNGVGNKRKTRNKDFLLNYSETPIDLSTKEGAIKANNIEITYSGSVKSSYEYDESAQNYKRSVNGKAHTDYVTKKQYTFKNIITYQVSNTSLNDGSGKDRQTLDNIGSGEGYYITNGYAVPITWSKSSRSSQTVYKYKDGTEIDVNDGNTFIQIQPKGKNLIIN
ncbi:putative uncharacterized protein [Firmicutes bacterium CAG:582]|nr:putative uncharacterized protein [Firmicutes bacterium CAG:582]